MSAPPEVPRAVAEAVPAATVVLLRDGGDGPEVLLVERHASMRFMAGMHVFPGGTLQPSDYARGGLHAPAAHGWPDTPDELAAALAMAAARETFEEAGLALDPAALLPLSRWITPRSEPMRFDTRFYVARAPDGQQPRHDERETVSLTWLPLHDVHAQLPSRRIRLSPPTAMTLNELVEAATVAAVLERCAAAVPKTIEPIMVVRSDELLVVFPGDPEHPVKARALRGPTRVVLPRTLPFKSD